MDDENRLLRVLAAERAPRRDPAFTYTVVQAVEAGRSPHDAAWAILRAAGLAAAAGAVLIPVVGLAGSDPGGVEEGGLAAAGLLTLVAGARLLAARARAVLRL